MRARFIGRAASLAFLLLLSVTVSLAGPRFASARLQEEADATPSAEDQPSRERLVTLVAWYAPDESGDFLTIGPLDTNQFLVAGPNNQDDRALTGRADFEDPDNDGLPRITLGESVFDAYPVYEDDPASVFRWLYFNDEPGERPGTLVMQIEATAGPYEGYIGTATFVSRSAESGGVLVIVLKPAE
ncbi:MAG TPA: hypothetical protein VIL01_04095 [Thermomicrobiales bacterium]